MNIAQLINDIEQLPPEAQRQIENFIAFIKRAINRQPKQNYRKKNLLVCGVIPRKTRIARSGYKIPRNRNGQKAMNDWLRQYCLSHGLLIPDTLIASTALCSNMDLATKNQRNNRFIENLTLLPY